MGATDALNIDGVMDKKYFDAVFKDPFDFDPATGTGEPWKSIAADLLDENDNEKEKKMKEFLELYRADPQIARWREPEDEERWECDEQLIKFLRAANWDVHGAVTIVQSYLNSGKLYADIVIKAIPKKLDHVWDKKLHAVSEHRDQYGRRIFIFRPGMWNPDEITVNELLAGSYMHFELMADEVKTQVAGVTCVCDMYGFGLKQLRNIGIEQIKCMTGFMAGSFPLWM